MKKMFIACLAFAASVFSAAAFSEQGEYWEITTKSEMKGMPFAMPAHTNKVCMPLVEKDIKTSMKEQRSNCEVTDEKKSGHKMSWKMKCIEKDGTMYTEGESTKERDSSHGTMHMTGKMDGRDQDMTMTSTGKRIGGSCDPDEERRKQKEAIENKMNQFKDDQKQREERVRKQQEENNAANEKQLAEEKKRNAAEHAKSCGEALQRHDYDYLASCPELKKETCKNLSNDVGDRTHYSEFAESEKIGKLVGECGLSMEKTRLVYCRRIIDENIQDYDGLVKHCEKEGRPLIDKLFNEHCVGRDYSSAMDSEYGSICMSNDSWRKSHIVEGAQSINQGGKGDAVGDTQPTDKKKKVGNNTNKENAENASSKGEEDKSKSSNPAQSVIDSAKKLNTDSVIDGAKKLKGMFGF